VRHHQDDQRESPARGRIAQAATNNMTSAARVFGAGRHWAYSFPIRGVRMSRLFPACAYVASRLRPDLFRPGWVGREHGGGRQGRWRTRLNVREATRSVLANMAILEEHTRCRGAVSELCRGTWARIQYGDKLGWGSSTAYLAPPAAQGNSGQCRDGASALTILTADWWCAGCGRHSSRPFGTMRNEPWCMSSRWRGRNHWR